MNPTTLNLLAISVFAFTILSLVGPLLNISPNAVAVVLTASAGLLALDRYGWQGKGGNLLIDLLSSQSSEYRQRILHHEAGHFLVAHLLGIPVQDYTLSAWQGIRAGLPGLGGVVVDTAAIEALDNPKRGLTTTTVNHYSTVWMAGIAAERQKFGNAQGGDDDKAQLRRLWELTPPQNRTAAAADTQIRWALLQADTLLEDQSKAYQALVSAMGQQRSVQECCDLIEANRVETNRVETNLMSA
ncbi:MAG: ATP-dependent Zn protease [Cyanobacteria bacterium P01_D01_bin.105]